MAAAAHPRARGRLLANLVILFLLTGSTAHAVDFDVYSELVERSARLHDEVDSAGADAPRELLRESLRVDLEAIAWLDAFFEDPAFAAMSESERGLAHRDRVSMELLIASTLSELERCDEVPARLAEVLELVGDDDELGSRLDSARDEATECAASLPFSAILTCDPPDAEVLEAGAPLGACGAPIELAPGTHELQVAAEGYLAAVAQVRGQPGETVVVSVSLRAHEQPEAPPTDPTAMSSSPEAQDAEGRSPQPLHWTLWSLGAIGIGTGVAYQLAAGHLESGIEDPPAGQAVLDPQAERERVDDRRVLGYAFGGVGLAAAIAGTILYLAQPGAAPETRAWSIAPETELNGVRVGLRF